MISKNQLYAFYGICMSLLVVAFILSIKLQAYSPIILPVIVFVALSFIFSFRHISYIIAFVTPLSIKFMVGTAVINIPDEPLMLLLLFFFIIKIIADVNSFKPLVKESLTIWILAGLIWLLFTTITSTMPLISLKFLIARLWAVVFGYVWCASLFTRPAQVKGFFWSFGIGLSLVIIYTTFNHYQIGFGQERAMLVMQPFMDDHTVYSAVCAIILLWSVVLLCYKFEGKTYFDHFIAIYLIICCSVGVLLSYSRAAYMSVFIAFVFFILLKFKVKFRSMIIGLSMILMLGFIFNNELIQYLGRNKAVSGKSIVTDIKSISNIKNDDSNVERLNRWEAGWRMFKEKPLIGFGPGTYMFQYSSYQRPQEMTSISTTTGDMGGIHSEYFGPAVESGIIGFLLTILLFFSSINILMNIYYGATDQSSRVLSLAILLPLISYYFHGLMNNFLDQDKIAVIFWAMMGFTASLNIYSKRLDKFDGKQGNIISSSLISP